VAYLREILADPLTKKQSLIATIMEVFNNIPREAIKRGADGSGRGWRRSLVPRAILYD
jgi:hypothetical protein